jgi:uncharacterized protein YraI
VRSGPSTNYSVLTTLNYGDNIEVLENYNDSWKKVKVSYFDYSSYTTKSETGYVYSSFISTSNPTYTNNNYFSPPTSTYSSDFLNSSAYSTSSYVNTSTLNVRSGASTSFSVITTLSYGDKVEVIETANSSWTKVKVKYYDANSWGYKTATGYVFSSYLSDTNPTYSSSTDLSELLNSYSSYKSTTNYNTINSNNYLSSSYHPYGYNNGKITFWTDCGTDGEISIYLDGIYVGTLTKYVSDGSTPNCADTGTISTTKTAGTYKMVAKGTTYKWEGYITVTADKCLLQQLQK